MINELISESKVSFVGFNYQNKKILSEKKYYVVDKDYFKYFTKKYLNLNLLLDQSDHKNEIGLKEPCVCIKKIKNVKYLSVYFKEFSLQNSPYEDYHLNCFEKCNGNYFFKKYYYSTNKKFINNILKEYGIQNNIYEGLEICRGSSYRNKNNSDKIAIIDEKNNYSKIQLIGHPFAKINIPNLSFIAFGQDKNTDVKSYYFTNKITWKIPNKILYNLNEAI